MPYIYTVEFNAISISSTVELFYIEPADDKPVELLMASVTVRDTEVNEQYTCTINRFSSGYSTGAGGSLRTPAPTAIGNRAAGFSAIVNAAFTTGGTRETLHAEGWAAQNGFYAPAYSGGEFSVKQSELLCVRLENAPGAVTNFNGIFVLREYP